MTSTGAATGVINYAPHPDETNFSTASMPKLSPAAQAVLDAANGAQSYGSDDCLNESRWIAAAALRAAADHCHAQEIREADHTTRRWICVDNLLAIADELKAQ
jgi:hypothetical protein